MQEPETMELSGDEAGSEDEYEGGSADPRRPASSSTSRSSTAPLRPQQPNKKNTVRLDPGMTTIQWLQRNHKLFRGKAHQHRGAGATITHTTMDGYTASVSDADQETFEAYLARDNNLGVQTFFVELLTPDCFSMFQDIDMLSLAKPVPLEVLLEFGAVYQREVMHRFFPQGNHRVILLAPLPVVTSVTAERVPVYKNGLHLVWRLVDVTVIRAKCIAEMALAVFQDHFGPEWLKKHGILSSVIEMIDRSPYKEQGGSLRMPGVAKMQTCDCQRTATAMADETGNQTNTGCMNCYRNPRRQVPVARSYSPLAVLQDDGSEDVGWTRAVKASWRETLAIACIRRPKGTVPRKDFVMPDNAPAPPDLQATARNGSSGGGSSKKVPHARHTDVHMASGDDDDGQEAGGGDSGLPRTPTPAPENRPDAVDEVWNDLSTSSTSSSGATEGKLETTGANSAGTLPGKEELHEAKKASTTFDKRQVKPLAAEETRAQIAAATRLVRFTGSPTGAEGKKPAAKKPAPARNAPPGMERILEFEAARRHLKNSPKGRVYLDRQQCDAVRALEDWIRGLDKRWQKLRVAKVVTNLKGTFFNIYVDGLGSSYCWNKGAAHGSSLIYFTLEGGAQVTQKCFSEKEVPGGRLSHKQCREWASMPQRIPDKLYCDLRHAIPEPPARSSSTNGGRRRRGKQLSDPAAPLELAPPSMPCVSDTKNSGRSSSSSSGSAASSLPLFMQRLAKNRNALSDTARQALERQAGMIPLLDEQKAQPMLLSALERKQHDTDRSSSANTSVAGLVPLAAEEQQQQSRRELLFNPTAKQRFTRMVRTTTTGADAHNVGEKSQGERKRHSQSKPAPRSRRTRSKDRGHKRRRHEGSQEQEDSDDDQDDSSSSESSNEEETPTRNSKRRRKTGTKRRPPRAHDRIFSSKPMRVSDDEQEPGAEPVSM